MGNRHDWAIATRAAVLVLGVLVGGATLLGTAWDATFEASPANSDSVGQGASRIRELKREIQQHLVGEILLGSGTGDSGRLRPGAARAFISGTAPTVIGAQDHSGTAVLDSGRLWVDTTNLATTGVQLNYYSGASWLPAAPPAVAVPVGGIILWDQATGCSGAANVCPCGYAEATEFRNLAVRGADTGTPVTTTIPDTAGVSCNASYAPTSTPADCAATSTDAYKDVQTDNTLFQHSYLDRYSTYAASDNGSGGSAYTPASASSTTTAGQSVTWPGPFRTVLFCRKSVY